jgi:hypothetical protein
VPFVGRERETARLAAALAAGRNVILSGRFGMGRTSLALHLGEVARDRWQVVRVDFSQTPAAMCAALEAALPPSPRRRRRPRARPSYLAQRARVTRYAAAAAPHVVLALDDVGRLTSARFDFLRRLVLAERYRFIAIVEGHLPALDRSRLAAWLAPAARVHLDPLPLTDCRRFFAALAASRSLAWDSARLDALARAAAGYPLLLQELARRELGRAAARQP